MIEQVAKALAPMCYGKGNMPMAIARDMARVAIAAMREPTDMMGRLGYYQAEDCIKDRDCGDAGIHVWRAMIDEALKPTAPEQS